MPAADHTPDSGADPAAPFTWPVRVYYEDTDAGGVVYYANYLKFFERCRTEWLRALGVDQSALALSPGLQFVVAEVEVKYFAPARLDDELLIDTRTVSLGRCSIVFEQSARRAGAPLARALVKVACIDAQRRVPARVPEWLRARMAVRTTPSPPAPLPHAGEGSR